MTDQDFFAQMQICIPPITPPAGTAPAEPTTEPEAE